MNKSTVAASGDKHDYMSVGSYWWNCTAPCDGRIGATDYAAMVGEVTDFLSGRSRQVQDSLLARMEAASEALEFETAAVFRDRVRALAQIQAKQEINVSSGGEADVIAVHQDGGQACVEVFFFRSGQNYGNRNYFPVRAGAAEAAEVLSAFLGQFYENKHVPRHVVVSHDLPERALIEEALVGERARQEALRGELAEAQRAAEQQAHVTRQIEAQLGATQAEAHELEVLNDQYAKGYGLEDAVRYQKKLKAQLKAKEVETRELQLGVSEKIEAVNKLYHTCQRLKADANLPPDFQYDGLELREDQKGEQARHQGSLWIAFSSPLERRDPVLDRPLSARSQAQANGLVGVFAGIPSRVNWFPEMKVEALRAR